MAETTWKIDPAHTAVEFSVKHMMFTTVRGRFTGVEATIQVDEERPDQSSAEVTIEAKTIDTAAPDRDKHLRSADFLDADTHPQLIFRSKRIEGAAKKQGDRFKVIGDLTMRGQALEVRLDCTYLGQRQDPWGQTRAGFTATTTIDRREWGLK